MSGSKPPRPIAGDVGTADRIEADDGHYWVRLATREAIRAEGFAMGNCLARGFYVRCAFSGGPYEAGLWSLRRSTGSSVALAELSPEWDTVSLVQFRGPKNAMASAFAYRQLHHLGSIFAPEGLTLAFSPKLSEPVVIANGSTCRWDRAPKALRLPDHEARIEARRRIHDEARKRREAAERMRENQPPIPDGEPVQRFATEFAEMLRERLGVPVYTDLPRSEVRKITGVTQQDGSIVVSLTDGTELHLPARPEPEAVEVQGEITYDAWQHAVRGFISQGLGL